MKVAHLLVIEDDPDVARLLQLDLQDAGYRVSRASGVASGLIQVRESPPDLVLLDLELPDGAGRGVLSRLRQHSNLPVIILTAQEDVSTKVELLDLGADDYVVKPYRVEELLARVLVQLRRSSDNLMTFGSLEVSVARRTVRYAGKSVALSPLEFQVMQVLSEEPGRLYATEEIFARIWGEGVTINANLLAAHIVHLRAKLRAAGGYGLIRTARGFGYALRVQVE